MGEENVNDKKLMLDDEAAAREKSRADRERLLGLTAEDLANAFPTLVSPVDAAAFTPELGRYLYEGAHEGLEPGDEGWWDDALAAMRPWGFELEEINVPVQLWHGRHDKFVPFQHGEWLASRIPGVEAHLTEEDGHITLLQRRVGEAQAWLVDHL